MIVVMTAKWVGDALGTDGIYATWIAMHRYPWLPPVDFKDFRQETGESIMKSADSLIKIEDGALTVSELGMSAIILLELQSLTVFRSFPCPLYVLWLSCSERARFSWVCFKWKTKGFSSYENHFRIAMDDDWSVIQMLFLALHHRRLRSARSHINLWIHVRTLMWKQILQQINHPLRTRFLLDPRLPRC